MKMGEGQRIEVLLKGDPSVAVCGGSIFALAFSGCDRFENRTNRSHRGSSRYGETRRCGDRRQSPGLTRIGLR
jgi:hypothetical protein